MPTLFDSEKWPGCAVVPYVPTHHEEQVFSLWQRVCGRKWSIELHLFRVLFPEKQCLVALSGADLIGFVGTMPAANALTALFVRPDCQRQGVGMRLFSEALRYLRGAGVKTAAIGGLAMLWKGVPTEFETALQFFAKAGCTFTDNILDQYRYLDDFQYPKELDSSLTGRGISLCVAEETDTTQVVEFQKAFFPNWTPYFVAAIKRDNLQKIVCLKRGNEILGTALIGGLGAIAPGAQWTWLTKKGFGSIATLGINPRERGKGLGYALFAYAAKCVKDTGAGVCFINYSEAAPLYRKFDFTDWSEYKACEIRL
jgi:GNAT superfamily N-acetyltransferase